MADWTPERLISPELVHELIASEFRDLSVRSCEVFGEGWDNQVFEINREWLFRFPRREVALAGIEREIRILPRLAEVLPLKILQPKWIGKPGPQFDWAFYGYRKLEGEEAARLTLADRDRASWVVPLAEFLRALHADSVLKEFNGMLPVDPNARGGLSGLRSMDEG